MAEEPEDYEHGGGYEPDAFAPLNSPADLAGDGQAVGCLILYGLAVAVFVAEMLRAITGSAIWWLLMIPILYFAPRIWAAFRLWQRPEWLDGHAALSALHPRKRRFWIMLVVVAMVLEVQFRLVLPRVYAWWMGW
jgi:hypothetical protein